MLQMPSKEQMSQRSYHFYIKAFVSSGKQDSIFDRPAVAAEVCHRRGRHSIGQRLEYAHPVVALFDAEEREKRSEERRVRERVWMAVVGGSWKKRRRGGRDVARLEGAS